MRDQVSYGSNRTMFGLEKAYYRWGNHTAKADGGGDGQFLKMCFWVVLSMGILTCCKPKDESGSGQLPSRDGSDEQGLVLNHPDAAKRTKVMIVADRYDTPFRNYQVQMLVSLIRTRAGLEVGAVEVMGNAQVQAQQVREAVESGSKILVVFPLPGEDVATALRDAVKEGVKVVTVGDLLPEGGYTAAVKVDDKEIGRLAGQLVVEALATKAREEGFTEARGRVVQLRGKEEEVEQASDRIAAGFAEVLSKESGVKLVHDAPGDWNEESAGARMREALRLQQPFDVVFAHNDLMAFAAAKVAEESGVRDQLLILGVDGAAGSLGGMELVRTEKLEATVYRPPLVDVVWELIVNSLEDENFQWPKVTEVKPFLLSQEDAEKFSGKGLPKPETVILKK